MIFETKKKITEDDLKTELVFFEGARACYFYTQYLIVYQKFCRHPVWPQDEIFVSPAREHHAKWYFFMPHWDAVEKYLERFLARPSDLELMEQYLIREREKGVARLAGALVSTLTESALRERMEFYFEQFNNLMVTAGTLRKVDQALLRRFKDIWSGKKDADARIAVAALPVKPASAVLEERAVLAVAANVEKGRIKRDSRKFQKEIERVHKTFAFGTMGYFDEKPKNRTWYEEEVGAALAKGAEKKIRDAATRVAEEKRRQEKLKGELSSNDRTLVEVASWASYLKDLFKFSENKLEYYAEPLFAETSCRSGYPVPFIKDLHPREILELIEGKKPNETKVSERVRHNVVIGMPGKLNILVGDEASIFEKQHLQREENGETKWKGRIASRGFATGAAKIVLRGTDFAKLQKGDILVVSNTSPDFVPIMRRAAAIVAEEGGLTAHVSVVSREFRIPCVVGIPHITTTLKDGDVVEVDANSGIIRKLSV